MFCSQSSASSSYSADVSNLSESSESLADSSADRGAAYAHELKCAHTILDAKLRVLYLQQARIHLDIQEFNHAYPAALAAKVELMRTDAQIRKAMCIKRALTEMALHIHTNTLNPDHYLAVLKEVLKM